MGNVGIRRKQWIALQERDYAIIRFGSEQRFVTGEQIRRRFFPGERSCPTRPERVAYRRILVLQHFGLLERRHVRTDPELIYQPSRLGLGKLAASGCDVMPYLPGIDLATFDHDRAVTDVRIAFERMGVNDWRSERRLREDAWSGRRPDGLFSLGKNRIALEVELNRKRDDRYAQIFRSYDERRDLDVVLYLCRTERLRQVVLGFAKKSATPRRCYAALWPDWQEHEARTIFQGCFDRLSLMELVP